MHWVTFLRVERPFTGTMPPNISIERTHTGVPPVWVRSCQMLGAAGDVVLQPRHMRIPLTTSVIYSSRRSDIRGRAHLSTRQGKAIQDFLRRRQVFLMVSSLLTYRRLEHNCALNPDTRKSGARRLARRWASLRPSVQCRIK